MLMRNITLPTGPYDWHPERISRAIYAARLAALQGLLQAQGLAGCIVAASTFDDGALVWLSGFTPKLGPAFAIVPAAGEPRLLFSGGAGMRASAERLTWFAEVAALGGLANDLAGLRAAGGAWGLVENAGLSAESRRIIVAALGCEPVDLSTAIARLRRVPEAEVLPLIVRAGAVMQQVEAALLGATDPARTRWAVRLAAERAAEAAGAQDIRMRLSRREGGPAEPVDPDGTELPAAASAALAVRVEGYWLCGRTWLGRQVPALSNSWERLAPRLSAGNAPASFLPLVAPARVDIREVGHSLAEAAVDVAEPLASGQCVAITLATGSAGATRLSAVVEIAAGGARPLWIAAPLQPTEQLS